MLCKLSKWRTALRLGIPPWADEKAVYAESIRRELAFWGIDASNMSDEQIEQGADRISECLSKIGFTTQEMMDAFQYVQGLLSADSVNSK